MERAEGDERWWRRQTLDGRITSTWKVVFGRHPTTISLIRSLARLAKEYKEVP